MILHKSHDLQSIISKLFGKYFNWAIYFSLLRYIEYIYDVGIIGSGREHALCLKLNQSKIIEKIYCFPGNAGTNLIANNIEINISDFKKIKKIWKKKEMLVVGPENHSWRYI